MSVAGCIPDTLSHTMLLSWHFLWGSPQGDFGVSRTQVTHKKKKERKGMQQSQLHFPAVWPQVHSFASLCCLTWQIEGGPIGSALIPGPLSCNLFFSAMPGNRMGKMLPKFCGPHAVHFQRQMEGGGKCEEVTREAGIIFPPIKTISKLQRS